MEKSKKRIFDIIQIGTKFDTASKSFDAFIVIAIVLNLFVVFFGTFEESAPYKNVLDILETITVIIFTVEYALRIWTAEYLYPDKNKTKAIVAFILSFYGIVDLLSFLPFYLPFLFPTGVVAFRMLRVIRIFKLFRINTQYDAFNVITDVLKEKKNQIISSVIIIAIFMVAASMCMYGVEHEVQPDKFKNAFSGIWWAASTLLTVGYGDLYPITTLGKLLAIVITFLGVGLVAIPTGIISAGFVEQYTKVNLLTHRGEEKELKFVASVLPYEHPWNGKQVKECVFPPQLLLVSILRDEETIIPKGTTELQFGDTLVMAAKHFGGSDEINLKEVKIKSQHEWVGHMIKDLDMSKLDMIVMIRRNRRNFIPRGNTVIKVGDEIIIHSKATQRDNS